jgi:hypothetical protein
MSYTREKVQAVITAKGYKWFNDDANKSYDVNIVGIRNSATGNKVSNMFDDLLTVSFKDEKGVWQYFEWAATTEPGKKGVMQYHNSKGVARLIPNQYRTTWAIDKHQGKYDALCQRLNNVDVWRDNNKNLTFDEILKDSGMFGINIHKAGKDSTWVENWSEGCQVFKRVKDFDEFMKICKRAAKIHGNKFSYTLLESKDFN